MRWVILGLLVWCAACGDDDRVPIDAGSDVAFDASFDALPDVRSDVGMDAGPDAPAGAVEGTVRYERRAIGAGGLGAPMSQTIEGVEVVLLSLGAEVERTVTDASGAFRFASEGTSVRVIASGTDGPVEITDFTDSLYAWEASIESGRADLTIDLANFSGALAMVATLRDGLAFAHEAFDRAEAFPALRVYWERGRNTPLGTSYASGNELWILGGPDDTDEFDTPVLLHELGHYLQGVYDFYDIVDGDFHAGILTDPRLAWGEGWATFFSSAARGDGFYGDTVGDELAYALDISSLPYSTEYVGRPAEPVTQTLSEWLIAGSLFELYRSGDEAVQRQRSFDTLTGWVIPRRGDRARPMIDFVDFLDGYLCLHPEEESLVESIVVESRRFPYDLDPVCTKPFDGPLGVFARPSIAVPLPGVVQVDGRGRSLRVIPLQRAASMPIAIQ